MVATARPAGTRLGPGVAAGFGAEPAVRGRADDGGDQRGRPRALSPRARRLAPRADREAWPVRPAVAAGPAVRRSRRHAGNRRASAAVLHPGRGPTMRPRGGGTRGAGAVAEHLDRLASEPVGARAGGWGLPGSAVLRRAVAADHRPGPGRPVAQRAGEPFVRDPRRR